MPQLPFEAVKFGTPMLAASPLNVSWAELAWAAITVGASPTAGPIPARPLLEMAWRALMVFPSLDSSGGRFCKHDSYVRLDPSEKSAVSYFLGMAQAKVTLNRLLGVSHLAHLDPLLRAAGRPLRGSRPDFLGIDPTTRRLSVAVEAKGRTNDWTADLMKKAKEQARLLPSVIGRASTMEIASAAWFDDDGFWNARLEDPDRIDVAGDPVSVGQVLVGYYAPIVQAGLRARVLSGASSAPEPDGAARTSFDLPDVDIKVEIPSRLIETWILADSSLRESASSTSNDGGTSTALVELAAELRSPVSSGEEPSTYRGPDGVDVRLGPSWSQKPD